MRILKESTEFVITIQELQSAFPELAKAYKSVFGAKHPKINVDVRNVYRFDPNIGDSRFDNFVSDKYFFYRNGRIIPFDAHDDADAVENKVPFKNYNLGDGDAVLICHYGYHPYVELIVNPSFVNQTALPVSGDLNMAEEYVLLIHKFLISSARLDNFLRFEWQGKYTFENMAYPQKEMIDTIKNVYGTNKKKEAFDLIKKSLAARGLMAVNSAGSAKLTQDGINMALQLKKNSKYIVQYN